MNTAAPPPLYTVWLKAQRSAVAAIHNPQSRRHARLELDATVSRIARPAPGATSPSSAALAAAVRAELGVPGRYRLQARGVKAHASWFEVLWGWVADRFASFYDALSKRLKIGPGIEATLGDFLILALILVIAFALAQLVRGLQIVRERSEALLTPIDSRRSAQAIFVRAGTAAEAGDYAVAIRLLFAATVTLLELRGFVRDDASSTVNELQLALRARKGAVEEPFGEIARSFTKAAYAERPVERQDWLDAREAYHLLAQRASTA